MSNIPTLEIVDISNNYLSGALPFQPSFQLIGLTSNLDLSLPVELNTIIESPTETLALSTDESNINIPPPSNAESNINLPLIIGLSAGALVLVLLVIGIAILFKRREQGKETDLELRLLPKYSSPNKQIRLMKMLNSGGFGVVWEARYKGQTVAIMLIRMDKYIGKGKEHERKIQTAKMVVDEASIMGLMIHERIVRFIIFFLFSHLSPTFQYELSRHIKENGSRNSHYNIAYHSSVLKLSS
jgi:hypothetical protein